MSLNLSESGKTTTFVGWKPRPAVRGAGRAARRLHGLPGAPPRRRLRGRRVVPAGPAAARGSSDASGDRGLGRGRRSGPGRRRDRSSPSCACAPASDSPTTTGSGTAAGSRPRWPGGASPRPTWWPAASRVARPPAEARSPSSTWCIAGRAPPWRCVASTSLPIWSATCGGRGPSATTRPPSREKPFAHPHPPRRPGPLHPVPPGARRDEPWRRRQDPDRRGRSRARARGDRRIVFEGGQGLPRDRLLALVKGKDLLAQAWNDPARLEAAVAAEYAAAGFLAAEAKAVPPALEEGEAVMRMAIDEGPSFTRGPLAGPGLRGRGLRRGRGGLRPGTGRRIPSRRQRGRAPARPGPLPARGLERGPGAPRRKGARRRRRPWTSPCPWRKGPQQILREVVEVGGAPGTRRALASPAAPRARLPRWCCRTGRPRASASTKPASCAG